MSKSPPAFQLYSGQWLTGTKFMTFEQKGIYLELLCLQWEHIKIKVEDLPIAINYCWNKSNNCQQLDEKIREKFIEKDGFIFNEKLFEMRESYNNFRKKQSINGKKGGRPKKITQIETQIKPKTNPNKSSLNKEYSIKNKDQSINVEVYPTFDDFWNLYDKKKGKVKSQNKWNKFSFREKLKIMQHIPYYKQEQPNRQYRKNPLTYFNDEAWLDEIYINSNKNENNYRNETREKLGI